MRKILTIISLLLLALSVDAQTARQLKVYQRGGAVDTLRLSPGTTISHSKTDAAGRVYDDYVTLEVRNFTPPAEGQDISSSQPLADGSQESVRHYLIADLDSLVFPDGRTVVFRGATTGKPDLAPVHQGGADGPLHSSFSGTFPGSGSMVTFYWTENDHLRLETGQESRATSLSRDKTNAEFVFEDIDPDVPFYSLYYPDKTVTILDHQTQKGANNSDHIGTSGDCGTAIATRGSDGTYGFELRHQAAYLCFLPHIDYLPSVRVSKIELKSSENIAGTYQMSAAGLFNGQGTSKTITLDLLPGDLSPKDFLIGHDKNAEQDSCAAYMVIAPQGSSCDFTATYYLTDTLSRIVTTYSHTFSLTPQANTVYPVTCNIPESLFRTVDLGYDYLWANANFGSNQPAAPGYYYTWEAAGSTLEDSWAIPTEDAASELLDKCSWTWGTYNGTDGWMVEGTNNGNMEMPIPRIFLPLTGYQDGSTMQQSAAGYYWLDTQADGSASQQVLTFSRASRERALMNGLLAMNTRPAKLVPRAFNIPYAGTDYVDLRGHGPGYTIQVYDHGGPDAWYSSYADGSLLITCAEGYKLNVSGSVSSEEDYDFFEVYDGKSTGGTMLAKVSGADRTLDVTSSSNILLLRFNSDRRLEEEGVDVTVTIVKTTDKFRVTVADVENGTLATSATEALPEDTITLTATPAPGYILDHIRVDAAGHVLTLYEEDPLLLLSASMVQRHYLMGDTVPVNRDYWYGDVSTFLMPYSDVVVTPVFVNNQVGDYIWMPAHDTVYVHREYVQRLMDSGTDTFRFCDEGGPSGNNLSWGDYSGHNKDGYMYVEAPPGYIMQVAGKISTEPGYDYLYLHSGNTTDHLQLLAANGWTDDSSRGMIPFSTVVTQNNRLFMNFHVDWTKDGQGFDGTVKVVPDTITHYRIPFEKQLVLSQDHMACRMERDGLTSIKVFDHAGPDANYSSNANGSLLIELPEGYHARVYGTVDSEIHQRDCDPLGVYDGSTTSANRLFYGWGDYVPVDVTTSSNRVLLTFHSDYNTERSGVNLTVDFVPDE